jgi:hypothetical protein
LGWSFPIYGKIWKHNIHVPNQQPDEYCHPSPWHCHPGLIWPSLI